MGDFLTATIVIAFGVSMTYAVTYNDCSDGSVKSCLGDELHAAQSSQEGTVPSFTPEELKRVCNEYSKAKSCLPSFRGYCTKRKQAELDSLSAVFGYLCTDGFSTYVANSECFLDANDDLARMVKECLSSYDAATQDLMLSRGTKIDKLSRLCTVTNTYVKCSGDSTRSHCGKEAGDLIVELAKRVFRVVFQQLSFDCVISSSTTATWNCTSIIIATFLFMTYIL